MELKILTDIVIIFALAVVVNWIFTKIKIPTIVGYLITGIVAGPHLLGLIGSEHEIELMAEIGVILLLFTIGMEFSLKHLIRIRRVVFLGGFLQVMISTVAFMFFSRMYNLDWKPAIFIGFMVALSSSALVLKILQERSELTSNYGRTVLGILIFQDIMLVPLLLFSKYMGDFEVDLASDLISLGIKTVAVIAFVYVGHKWIFPWLLKQIALTKNQELFMMSVLLICLAVALLTSELGMSLAFGAFLAGLMISESEYSHNAFGSLILFKDTFTSFFFVSVGMLLDLSFVADNLGLVLLSVALVVVFKTLIAGGTSFVLGHTFKGTVMAGLALAQVGEFSFILAKIGMDLSIIDSSIYQLFLAVAVITMSMSPFLIKIAHPFSELLLKLPFPKWLVEGLYPLKTVEFKGLKKHTVFIGKDLVSVKLSVLAKYVNMPYVSIVFDPYKARELQQKGENVLYGDASNIPILEKAFVQDAETVVVSVGELASSLGIIEKVRNLNPHAFILVRARNINDIELLFNAGANQIFPENFEIAIDLFNSILTHKLMPQKDINQLMTKIRSDFYGVFRDKDLKDQPNLLDELPNLEIVARRINGDHLIGKSLIELKIRKHIGVTVVAIKRGDTIIEHPDVNTQLMENDVLYLMGKPEQMLKAYEFFG